MDAITDYAIEFVNHTMLVTDNSYHPTTIAYIQTLLRPYAEAIDTATDINSIEEWIPLAFPPKMAELLLLELKVVINRIVPFFPGDMVTEQDRQLRRAKKELIQFIIITLCGSANDIIDIYPNENTVLPWDIQSAVRLVVVPELSEMFGITVNDKGLPVNVTINNNTFTHLFSDELTCGLLLFSLSTDVDFNISLFGHPFGKDYFVTGASRFHLNDETLVRNFSVIISGQIYTFDTPNFMQGFITGAQWMDVDHRQYWSNLTQYTKGPNGIVAISITF